MSSQGGMKRRNGSQVKQLIILFCKNMDPIDREMRERIEIIKGKEKRKEKKRLEEVYIITCGGVFQ